VAERSRQLSGWERMLERIGASKPGGWWFVNVSPHIDRRLVPATDGRFSTAIGQQVLVVETIGAKSGQPRRTPLVYVTDGDRIVVIASKAGAKKHPAWYHNLKANPEVQVWAKGRSGRYRAREAEGEERDRLWALAADYYSGFDTYQSRAGGRKIPVMVLEPA
jgi:deazaflavin-dependent oxidoreductase (nitroreductase family)